MLFPPRKPKGLLHVLARLLGALCSVLLCAQTASHAAAGDTSLHLIKEGALGTDRSDDSYFTPADGTFNVGHGPDNVVWLEFQTLPGSTNFQHWIIEFAVPVGQTLEQGLYATTASAPFFNNTEPGLDIGGNGESCQDSGGYFSVKEITYGPGTGMQSFWVEFESHCGGAIPATTGELRYNANTPLEVFAPLGRTVNLGQTLSFPVSFDDPVPGTVPTKLSMPESPPGAALMVASEDTAQFTWTPGGGQVGHHRVYFQAKHDESHVDEVLTLIRVVGETSLILNSEPGDYIGGGRNYHYTATNSTFGLTELGSNGVRIAFSSSGADEFWWLQFRAPDGRRLTTGVYEDARRFQFGEGPGQPGLDISGGNRGCYELNGRFLVRQIAYAPNDRILSFWAEFEQHCDGAASAMRGEVRFNMDPLPLSNAPPVATCPPQVVTCPPTNGATLALAATVTDPEGDAVTVAWEVNGQRVRFDTVPAGASSNSVHLVLTNHFPVGLTAIRLVLSDSTGNSNFCHTTAYVVPDYVPPTLSCPPDLVRTNNRGQCWARIALSPPAATDDCSAPVVTATRSDGKKLKARYPVGFTTVTWIAKDAFGNSTNCMQTISVVDAQPPVVRCYPYFPAKSPLLTQNRWSHYTLIARDNCPRLAGIYVADTGSAFVAGPFPAATRVQLLRKPFGPAGVQFDTARRVTIIYLQGNAQVYARDAAGNQSIPVACAAALVRSR